MPSFVQSDVAAENKQYFLRLRKYHLCFIKFYFEIQHMANISLIFYTKNVKMVINYKYINTFLLLKISSYNVVL